MSDRILNAETLAKEKGYPIVRVPITADIARLCTSESKLLAVFLGVFASLKKRETALADLTREERDLLTKFEQSSTPVIVPVSSADRSEEPFIVGLKARKSKGKEDSLQFRLPTGQQMTPEQLAVFNSWDKEKKAEYSRRLTEDDHRINMKFSNRHRGGKPVLYNAHTVASR